MGCGTVGSGFLSAYEQFEKKSVDLILVRDKRKYKHFNNRLTDDFEEVLSLQPDVIVETMGGLSPAYDYVKTALKSGIHVITANKDLLAEYGKELFDLANKHDVKLKYEASVGGGIPIISNLNNYHFEDEITCIEGILNGTSNYILSKMNQGISFDEALKDAQKNGFAEDDPKSDVEGLDPARKVSVLIQTAFNTMIDWQDVLTSDISTLDPMWLEFANKNGFNMRLICSIQRVGKQIYSHITPQLLSSHHMAYNINDEANYVSLFTDYCQESTLVGKGAGKKTTGYAVYRDYKDLDKGHNPRLTQGDVKFLDEANDWLIKLDHPISDLVYEELDDQVALVKAVKESTLKKLKIKHIQIRR